MCGKMFFCIYFGEGEERKTKKITEHESRDGTHIVCQKRHFGLQKKKKKKKKKMKTVHDKIKSMCIWPSASKACVYKKRVNSWKCTVGGKKTAVQVVANP